MTSFHQLSAEQFERLAAGAGGVSGVDALRAAQLSKHLLLIGHLLRSWPGDPAERDTVATALDRARERSAERFADVIGAPLVGAWASIVARAVRHGTATRADFTQLGALAMVACAEAGVDAEAVAPVRDGSVVLPGVGAVPVAGRAETVVTVVDGAVTVRDGDPEATQPLRHLMSGHGGRRIRVGLDDLDPYRHGHHAPPTPRLSPAEVAQWQDLLDGAWRLLAERLPERADELAAGLRTLVPLVQLDQRSSKSATIRHAFGVFGLTRPPSPIDFAVTLVHEFQHSKLSAMLDLMPLTDPADDRRYFAPWRVDPRPLSGLLQGVYAFVGVADTWRALQGAEPTAEREFAEARLQVDHGLAAIERSGALTAAGRQLAARLRTVTDSMLAEPVRAEVAEAAELALRRTREQWLARNG
jgi:uncharacterized protein